MIVKPTNRRVANELTSKAAPGPIPYTHWYENALVLKV